ncbi:DsbA family protein [Hahella ganghwensis]|uniref:DsbA family protein n=1 Tax=Hahella ganghwensis TaxID=286420 RepID=UPI00036F1AF8|nr:thioredoxin domain-containing protein [Hahella ganghwensis]
MAKSKFSVPPIYVGIIMFALGLFVATLLQSNKLGLNSEPSTDSTLFTLMNESYTLKDLPYPQASAVFALDQHSFEQKTQEIQKAALTLHLDKLAKESGQTREEVRNDLIDVEPVSDEEVSRFYETNKAQISQPFYAIKDALKNALNRDRLGRAEQRLIDDLISRGLLSVNLTPPEAPSVTLDLEGYPAKGSDNAVLTIAEFADYRCPHCKVAATTLQQLQEEYPDRIRLVMIDFPVLGDQSRMLAKAAFCAGKQDKFWSYHEALFANQERLSQEVALELASDLGVDTEQLSSCMESEESTQQIERSAVQAVQLGLTGTPAIFINGIAYRGRGLDNALRDHVKAALNVSH